MGCESEGAPSPEVVKVAAGVNSSSSFAESNFRELDDAFLQTQTRIWLGEVLQIRLDEQLIISELLADGELLFQVSKVVWKLLLAKHVELRHIKAYRNQPFAYLKNSGRYRPYSYVDSFLKICKILGLCGIDLFSPSDVVEKKNTRRVCMCIRSFSKKARSRSINVPDFDIVTYTVAMPKYMVGSILRNLELAQSMLAYSPSYYLRKHAGRKIRQGYSVTTYPSNYETHSGESDDRELCHPVLHSDGLHTNILYDTSEIDSNLEDSQVSPTVNSVFSSIDLDQLDIQSHQRNETFKNEYELLRLTEPLQYLCSEKIEHDCKLTWPPSPSCGNSQIDFGGMASHLNTPVKYGKVSGITDLNYSEHDLLGNNSSVIGNPVNDKKPATRDASEQVATSSLIGDAKGCGNCDLLYEENDTSYVLKSASSHGSNSAPGTVEIRRCSGMSWWSSEALNLGDQFDANNNVHNIRSFHLHHNKTALYRGVMEDESKDSAKYKEMSDGITSIATYSNSVTEFEESEHSLYSPDRYLSKSIYLDRAVSLSSDISSTPLKMFSAFKDRRSRIDLKGMQNAICNQTEELLSCQSFSLPELCKWDQKGKCAVTSDGVNDNKGYSSSFSVEGIHEKTTPRIQHKASKVLSSKVMLSCEPNDEKEVVSAAVVNLDTDDKQSSSYCLAVSSDNYSEKCPAVGHDANDFPYGGVITRDNGDVGERVVDVITDDVSSSYHNVLGPVNCESCLTHDCSKLGCNNGHQACQYDINPVCRSEHTCESHGLDELKPEDECVLSVSNSAETEAKTIEIPKGKPQKKLLLKTVLGGAAAFGLLYVFLHLRRNGGQNVAQSSMASKHTGKEKDEKYSPPTEQKRSRTKTAGIYPAEKLKLGD